MRRERQGKGGLVWLLAIYALLLAAGLLSALDGRYVRFYMNGRTEMELPLGTRYVEPGCRAVSAGRVFGEGRRAIPVAVSGTVDADVPGDYVLCYEARRGAQRYHASRTVHVVDRTAPIIRLESREGYSLTWFDEYEEEGYSAWDELDGDLTAQVSRTVYDDRVTYKVADAAGNQCIVTRRLPFTLGRPTITLAGGEQTQYPRSLRYVDPGFTATDAQGNDLSAFVRVTGEVTPTVCGSYARVYTIENGRGDAVSVTRQIEVVPAALPEIAEPEEKTIYLTFDDGPGPYTGRLLDVLADCGVQASFFVTCNSPDDLDMVGRAAREGHTVCVHSASHDYGAIYASEEAFYRDFEACEDMILAQTGSYTRLFRFPGGSSNTVSRFNRGVMSRLAENMSAMGYRYFDWNVSSGDAGGTTTAEGVYQNIVSGCAGKQVCVVLQHDVKPYSVAAVRRVIDWGRENGYTFKALDLTSPPMQHPIAN